MVTKSPVIRLWAVAVVTVAVVVAEVMELMVDPIVPWHTHKRSSPATEVPCVMLSRLSIRAPVEPAVTITPTVVFVGAVYEVSAVVVVPLWISGVAAYWALIDIR